jgi:phosphoserine aminotransferase
MDALKNAKVGRSHRAVDVRARMQEVVDLTRKVLEVPADYHIAITPGSDTGAMEMAIWSLLGPRGVDVLVFDHFGHLWLHDVREELKLTDARALAAPFGHLPKLSEVDSDRDVVFCWNGTTTGVCVPSEEWISPDRKGLTICDATSAAFAYDLPWDLLDVTTYSWQKVMGGEAAHGMIILSPRALERWQNYTPPWPMPRLFRIKKGAGINMEFFKAFTINTPSLLCIEDAVDALRYMESIGGLSEMVKRSKANLQVIADWVKETPWIDFAASESETRSRTSICLVPIAPGGYDELSEDQARKITLGISDLLRNEKIAFDIRGHLEAPPSLRIWGGGMVETADIKALLPWIEWAYKSIG